MPNNEILISAPDKGRSDWQDYIQTKPAVNHFFLHEGTHPGICSPSLIKQNYIPERAAKAGAIHTTDSRGRRVRAERERDASGWGQEVEFVILIIQR